MSLLAALALVSFGAILGVIGAGCFIGAFIASLPRAEADYPEPDPAWAANDDGPEDYPPTAA